LATNLETLGFSHGLEAALSAELTAAALVNK
jgi:hypothetical protein